MSSLTVEEAAGFIGVNEITVRRLIYDGRLQVISSRIPTTVDIDEVIQHAVDKKIREDELFYIHRVRRAELLAKLRPTTPETIPPEVARRDVPEGCGEVAALPIES